MSKEKGKGIELGLAVITAVAWIIYWLAYFTYRVWSEEWGPTASPTRIGWEYGYTFCTLLWGILWMYKFSKIPKWNVPPGTMPAEGARVKIFSPYTLTGIALVGAVFAVAGLGEFIRVDLQALTIAASAAYFGSIISFFGLWIGQVIARLWFVPWVMGGAAGFLDIAAWVTMDASIWSYNGYLFFKFYHSKPQWSRIKRLALIMVLGEPIHIGFWEVRAFVVNPLNAAIATVIVDTTTYWSISWILVLIGYIIGASAYEARSRTRRA